MPHVDPVFRYDRTHQADVQQGPSGSMDMSTESDQQRRVRCARQGFQDRDSRGSSTADDHWLGYRTETIFLKRSSGRN